MVAQPRVAPSQKDRTHIGWCFVPFPPGRYSELDFDTPIFSLLINVARTRRRQSLSSFCFVTPLFRSSTASVKCDVVRSGCPAALAISEDPTYLRDWISPATSLHLHLETGKGPSFSSTSPQRPLGLCAILVSPMPDLASHRPTSTPRAVLKKHMVTTTLRSATARMLCSWGRCKRNAYAGVEIGPTW